MRLNTNDDYETYTVERLIGERTGLIRRVAFSKTSRDTSDVVIAKLVPKYDPEDLGITNIQADFAAVGKGQTKQEALRSAIGEYVERYCAFTGLHNVERLEASYEDLATDDLGVPSFDLLGLYREKQYENADPLTTTATVPWAVGTDLLSGQKRHLPVWLASAAEESPHGFTSSNGCAAGQSLGAATYRGLLELVERDALMRAWYTEATPERLLLDRYPDLQSFRSECEPAHGRIELLSLETPLPFETVGAAFVSRGEGCPKFLLAASSRLRFDDAVVDALEEISQLVRVYRRLQLIGKTEPDTLGIGDNGLYYAQPSNFDGVRRLISGPDVLAPDSETTVPADSTARLERVLEGFEAASMSPVAFEATNPEIRETGLRVVNTAVPELVPLSAPTRPTAGHPRLPDDAISCGPHPVP